MNNAINANAVLLGTVNQYYVSNTIPFEIKTLTLSSQTNSFLNGTYTSTQSPNEGCESYWAFNGLYNQHYNSWTSNSTYNALGVYTGTSITNGIRGEYAQITYPYSLVLTSYTALLLPGFNIRTWAICGSNDGTNWTTLVDHPIFYGDAIVTPINFAVSDIFTGYTSFRFVVKSVSPPPPPFNVSNASLHLLIFMGNVLIPTLPSYSKTIDMNTAISNASDLAVKLGGSNALTGINTLSNTLQIANNNVIHFGYNVAGKEANAGKIGYGTFSSGSTLDIVGAGTGTNRAISIWDNVTVQGTHTTLGVSTVGALKYSYTALPTFTSNSIGYTTTATGATTLLSINMNNNCGGFVNMPIGVWLVSYQINVGYSASGLGGAGYIQHGLGNGTAFAYINNNGYCNMSFGNAATYPIFSGSCIVTLSAVTSIYANVYCNSAMTPYTNLTRSGTLSATRIA